MKNFKRRDLSFSLVANTSLQLPDASWLMVKELVRNSLKHISGTADYSFYDDMD